MKHLNLILAGVMLVTIISLTSCTQSTNENSENVEKAEYKLMTAEADLERLKSDSSMAYTNFQFEADRILAENEIKMMELKAKLLTRRSEINTEYENDLEALRLRNEKIKADLKTISYNNKEKWENLKSDINKEIDNLGKSISAIAEKSEKKN